MLAEQGRPRARLQRAADGPTSEDTATPRRVLVVDDERSMRLLCRVNLPLSGFEVEEAEDGEAAVERAREQEFDLVLLDVMMPGMSGFEVAGRLRNDPRTADLPFVFLSARADEEDIRRGFEVGAADYITKPFDPLQLGDHLNTVLHAIESGQGERLRLARLGGTPTTAEESDIE